LEGANPCVVRSAGLKIERFDDQTEVNDEIIAFALPKQ